MIIDKIKNTAQSHEISIAFPALYGEAALNDEIIYENGNKHANPIAIIINLLIFSLINKEIEPITIIILEINTAI